MSLWSPAPLTGVFTGFKNSFEITHDTPMSPESCTEKSSTGVFNLLNSHTGSSNCENTEDTFLGGKKKKQQETQLSITTSGAVKAAAHYSD